MATNRLQLPSTRREFLKLAGTGISLLAFSRFAPSFLVQSLRAEAVLPEKDRQILVLVQLAGGNDGLNTVIPFEDADYYRLRPTIGIKKTEALRVSDTLGLHPAMTDLHALLKEGKAAIVQNVGYPNPNRSHFRSAEIWETASRSDQFLSNGWIGRYLDNTCAGKPAENDPLAIHIGSELPQTFFSANSHPTFGLASQGKRRRNAARDNLTLLENFLNVPSAESNNADMDFLRATMMNALVTERKFQQMLSDYKAEAEYPQSVFAQSLRNVAALIASGVPTRVYFVTLRGFDTHSNQLNTQQNLLKTLSEGLAAFQRDIDAHKLGEQVLTMTFSEFGRRPAENQSKGTDHGTAAPLFIMGDRIKGPLHGTAPSLAIDKGQDLVFSTDFRQVYATILETWLGCPSSEAVLGGQFQKLPILAL